jgi:hypothetical protein
LRRGVREAVNLPAGDGFDWRLIQRETAAKRVAATRGIVEYGRAIQGGSIRRPAEHELVAAGRYLDALRCELGRSMLYRQNRAGELELELPRAEGAADRVV